MQKYIALGISLPQQIVSEIDSKRGDISRSRYVLRILEKTLTENQKYNTATQNTTKSKKADLLDCGIPRLQSSRPNST